MMDSVDCKEQPIETGNESRESVVRIDSDSNAEITKNVDSQSPKANMMLPMGPVTPDSSKEIGNVTINLIPSPLTGLDKTICFDSDCSIPRTPGDVVFDPFAPGPEDMMLAPPCKKYTRTPKLSVSRRLDFDSNNDDDDDDDDDVPLSDDEVVESVCESLLKVIISMQTKGDGAELSEPGLDSEGDCETPPLAPRVKWIAETCPGAPMKHGGKSKNIDLGLCKKLEF